MDAIEAMESCIAMRYLKEDPLPADTLEKLIYTATRASSAGNSQGWEFVVITDPELKRRIGEDVMKGMAPVFANRPEGLDASQTRMYDGAQHLAENFARVPAWILGCGRKSYPPQDPQEVFMYASVYPAAQNLIVAARAMGIGTAFTTFHLMAEHTIRELIGIPEDVRLCVSIAAGYPERQFKKVNRRPVKDVMHLNRW